MKILLFDMDDVLLEAHGYHRALQDTVALVGRSLGYQNARLSAQDIAAFEAAGVTSEWDSSAICAVLLLEKAWSVDTTRKIPDPFSQQPTPTLSTTPPDFQGFAAALGDPGLKSLHPRKRADRLMLNKANHLTDSQKDTIRDFIQKARQIDGSPTHRIFQELIVGSEIFRQTYNLEPFFDTESYLGLYDHQALSNLGHASLVEWLELPHHKGVILTNRPSRAPQGYFCTPEAEIGARQVGLEMLPIAGFGGLTWLSSVRGKEQEAFLKPSPVHALTALRLALGDTLEQSLRTAAALAVEGQLDSSWNKLQGAHVSVFEDTTGGLESTFSAGEILSTSGILIEIQPYGITDNQKKRRALETTGASLHESLSSALTEAHILASDMYKTHRSKPSAGI